VSCECIGLKISTHVNGESVAKDLEEIFNKAGMPQAIIKDGDYTLNKGVRIWQEKQGADVSVIEDIGHSIDFIGNLFFDFANLLILQKSKEGFQ